MIFLSTIFVLLLTSNCATITHIFSISYPIETFHEPGLKAAQSLSIESDDIFIRAGGFSARQLLINTVPKLRH